MSQSKYVRGDRVIVDLHLAELNHEYADDTAELIIAGRDIGGGYLVFYKNGWLVGPNHDYHDAKHGDCVWWISEQAIIAPAVTIIDHIILDE